MRPPPTVKVLNTIVLIVSTIFLVVWIVWRNSPAPGSIVITPPSVSTYPMQSANMPQASTTGPVYASAFGSVTAVSPSGFTVSGMGGTSYTVTYNASTSVEITKTIYSTGSPSAVKVGDSVQISGVAGPGNAITAKQINLSETSGAPATANPASNMPPSASSRPAATSTRGH